MAQTIPWLFSPLMEPIEFVILPRSKPLHTHLVLFAPPQVSSGAEWGHPLPTASSSPMTCPTVPWTCWKCLCPAWMNSSQTWWCFQDSTWWKGRARRCDRDDSWRWDTESLNLLNFHSKCFVARPCFPRFEGAGRLCLRAPTGLSIQCQKQSGNCRNGRSLIL